MAFPPAEENLDVPSELVGKGNLFGSEIVPICGYPIIDIPNLITDQADVPFCTIGALGPKNYDSVIKDDAVGLDVIHSDNGLFRRGFDPADKMLFFGLPGIKKLVALVASIHDACFPRGQDLFDERPLRLLAVAEKDFFGNATIEIEPDMNLGLFRTLAVVGPVHG